MCAVWISGWNSKRGANSLSLIQKISSIQRIPLFRDKPGVPDQPPQFLFRGSMVRAGRRDYVFLNHDAADVVSAEAQPNLAGLQTRCYPGALDVLDVFQVCS